MRAEIMPQISQYPIFM